MQMTSSENVRELRVAVNLAVRVFGIDSGGKPFSNPARVVEISGLGAKLKDVQCHLKVGDVIGVQFEAEKSRFRVVWIGEPNTPEQDHIGIHTLEQGKCLWNAAITESLQQPSAGSSAATPLAAKQSADSSRPSAERRRYPRHPCRGTVLMSRPGGNPNTLNLLDLSLGGFYAETMSPLPVGTTAVLQITAQGCMVRGEGVVRTSHPSVGNGVAFTKMDEQNWRQLSRLIAQLADSSGAAEGAESDTIDAPLEALLQVLEARGVVTRAEFLQQLAQVKNRH